MVILVCACCNSTNIKKLKGRKPSRLTKEQILYERLTNTLRTFQEPSNLYELTVSLNTSYQSIEPLLMKQLQLGNVQQLENNPNKYILTTKGKHLLHLLNELNKFIETWESDIKIPNERPGRK